VTDPLQWGPNSKNKAHRAWVQKLYALFASMPDDLFMGEWDEGFIFVERLSPEEAQALGIQFDESGIATSNSIQSELSGLPIHVATIDFRVLLPYALVNLHKGDVRAKEATLVGITVKVTRRALLYKRISGGDCIGPCAVGEVLTILSDHTGRNGNIKVKHPTLGVGYVSASCVDVIEPDHA
jgi:hypothetical protein